MFGKLKTGSSPTTPISRDINESVKTLSYLARAEKFYDLELKKGGKVTKPLLKIVDVIEPLRRIVEATAKLEKGQPITEGDKYAFGKTTEIVEVANDILALNPKGLVSNDKIVLARLGSKIIEAQALMNNRNNAAFEPAEKSQSFSIMSALPKGKRGRPSKKDIEAREAAAAAAEAEEQQKQIESIISAAQSANEPSFTASNNNVTAQAEPSFETTTVETSAFKIELNQPIEWDNNFTGFRKLGDEEAAAPQPEIQKFGIEEDIFIEEEIAPAAQIPAQQAPAQQAPAPQVSENISLQQPVAAQAPAAEQEPQAAYAAAPETQAQDAQNVYSLKQPKKELIGLPQKYFATSYAGMNLQEAAEIISELAENPANLEIIMLEHASRVRPVAEAKEVVSDLLALAPIADSFETDGEPIDRKHLLVLKEAERIINICRDLSTVQAEGFDRRKQKLFEVFVPQDIKRIIEQAKVAYPEIFSTAITEEGHVVADSLLDFADLVIEFAEETGDKLYSEMVAQLVTQIALYSEHNDLRLKFDVNLKKNKLNATTQPITSRSEIAVLRAITFVPKIARHGYEVLAVAYLSAAQRETITRTLEILQLAYIHARDNYSSEIQNFYTSKAA